MDALVLSYPSVSALRHMAQHEPFKLPENGALVQKYLTGDKERSWYGMDGGAPAVLRAQVDGYPEGERTIRAFHDEIAASLPRALGHHRTKKRAAFGDELDVHAMNRGQFDRAWTSSSRTIRAGSGVLRLVIDICANAAVDAAALQWRGIAGLSLAEVMGKAGYSVEIVAAWGAKLWGGRNQLMVGSVVVKPRSTQADFGLLAATVALPGFFRTLGFASLVRACDDMGKIADSSLGTYADVSGLLPVPDKVTQIIVPGEVISKEKAVDWVKQTVALLQGARA